MVVRLRNKDTGVVVQVAESKLGRFGAGWERVVPAPPKRATRRGKSKE